MQKFFKAQLSSLTATLVDFSMTVFLVEAIHLHYLVAVTFGAIAGAITNFSINRQWSFNAKDNTVQKQSLKYGYVWTGSLLLNLSGTYILTHYFTINYLLSKVIIALLVGIGFNYTLQKHYVFATKKNS